MKEFRFVATTHHSVSAETLEKAIEAFNEMKQKGNAPAIHVVRRVEVQGDDGEYVPVDHPLRAGDLERAQTGA
jgi:hypothetical protein